MKEYPESNYFLDVSTTDVAFAPQLGTLLPRSYVIQVNLITRIVIVPWLPASPWPPPYPTDWDYRRDRDEAAWYLVATNVATVAPTEEREARIQTVVFPSELRLDELAPGPLVEFLRHELPRASLDAYERKILCLDPPPDSST